jgi:DNA topoisomerase I
VPRAAGAKAPRGTVAALRDLGAHPETGQPVTVHSGRFGPYVKVGDVNATLTGDVTADSVTLEKAVAIIAERLERTGGTLAKTVKKTAAKKSVAKKAAVKKAPAKKAPAKKAAKTAE